MGHDTETEKGIRLLERFKRQAQTLDDFNNEMAGREVGRISRFLGASASSSVEGQRRQRRQEAEATNLYMMASAAYQALLQQTVEKLQEAQSRITTVLDRIQVLRSQAEQARDAIAARAARLPDGAIVLRDREGTIRRADGATVAPELAATILWRGDEPSFEDWQFHQDRIERIDALQAEALDGQQIIGEMQTRVEDGEHEETPEELEALQEEVEAIFENLEHGLQELEVSATPAVAPATQLAALRIPTLE